MKTQHSQNKWFFKITTEKNPNISETAQFKPMLFKGQLCFLGRSNSVACGPA